MTDTERKEKQEKLATRKPFTEKLIFMVQVVGRTQQDYESEFCIEVRDYNPCFDRVLVPIIKPAGVIGPMYNGIMYEAEDGEMMRVMNRYETQEAYDFLSR